MKIVGYEEENKYLKKNSWNGNNLKERLDG